MESTYLVTFSGERISGGQGVELEVRQGAGGTKTYRALGWANAQQGERRHCERRMC